MDTQQMLSQLGISKILPEKCADEREFFHKWMGLLLFTLPITKKQAEVAAEMLLIRHEMKSQITDPILLDTMCVSPEAKRRCRERMGLRENNFNAMLRALKRAGFIREDGIIEKRYIPELTGSLSFRVILAFRRA